MQSFNQLNISCNYNATLTINNRYLNRDARLALDFATQLIKYRVYEPA